MRNTIDNSPAQAFGAVGGTLAEGVNWGFGLFGRWWQMEQQKHELRNLDERTMKDVGITQADIDRELARKPWHDPDLPHRWQR